MASPESIDKFLDIIFMKLLTSNHTPGSFPDPETLPHPEPTILSHLRTWSAPYSSPKSIRNTGTSIGISLSASAPRKGIELHELEKILRDVVKEGKDKQKEMEMKPGEDEMEGMSRYFALDDLCIFVESVADAVKKEEWRGRVTGWVMGVAEGKRG